MGNSDINPVSPAQTLWRVRLFDGLILEDSNGGGIRRFRSRRVGALLAYLALHLGQSCPRETLTAALWPEEADIAAAANRFRVALASLRHQLEPPGVIFGTVLDTGEPGCVRLRAEAVWCDLAAFDHAWKAGRKREAARLASGPLLPGYYDEWILIEQTRIETLREELESYPIADSSLASRQSESDETETEEIGSGKAGKNEPDSGEILVFSATAPPLPPNRLPYYRLPLYLTRFFGREEEIRQVGERVAENRLVTLTGSGGIGKTRLAVEAARHEQRDCVFVSLAELPDAGRLPEAVMQAMGMSPQADADPVKQLLDALQYRASFLLILDNAEHLLDAVASLSLQLLEAAPALRLLVTSRQRLDIPGESVFALQPLSIPPAATPPEALMSFAALALFTDRAKNARPDFAASPRHLEALVEICRRLEGMPLALELAAARVTAQSPHQIAAALATHLVDLKSRQRGLPDRHRSLRAVVQSSFDLMPLELRQFFALLSLFQGGWTADAANAVTGCAQAEECLEDLVARSLVVAREEEATGTLRYTFLETLRQFAAEQLSAEQKAQAAQRHAEYFLTLAAGVREDDFRSLSPLDGEQENLLLAVEWGRKHAWASFWKGLAGALIHAFIRGHHRVGAGWIDAVWPDIAAIEDAGLRFQMRYAACLILPDIGRLEETDQIAGEMMADAKATGDAVGAVYAACIQGYVAEFWDAQEAAVHIQRAALVQARALHNDALLQHCLSHTSGALYGYGVVLGTQTPAGRLLLQEAESLAREMLARVSPHSRRASLAPSMVAVALIFQNRKGEAYKFLKAAQQACIAMGTTSELMYAFIYECEIARERGFLEQAALLYGAFSALQERMGYSLARAESFRPGWIQNLCHELRERMGSQTFEMLAQRGRQTPPAEFATEWLPENARG